MLSRISTSGKIILGLWIFIFLLILYLFSSATNPVQADVLAGITPTPTRPPSPPGGSPPGSGGGGGGDHGDRGGDDRSDDPCRQGAIIGTVVDLCTGQPGAGIQILINGEIITTDGRGHYSITGRRPGQYDIALQLPGELRPAEISTSTSLGCQEQVSVDLNYYSCPLVPTPVPTPPLAIQFLPQAGASRPPNTPFLLVVLGVGLSSLALWLGDRHKLT